MNKKSVFILSFLFIVMINYDYLYKCDDLYCVVSNSMLSVFFAMNNVEIFNFIKGDKFDILLAPHYNTVGENTEKRIRVLLFFVLIFVDIGILILIVNLT